MKWAVSDSESDIICFSAKDGDGLQLGGPRYNARKQAKAIVKRHNEEIRTLEKLVLELRDERRHLWERLDQVDPEQ